MTKAGNSSLSDFHDARFIQSWFASKCIHCIYFPTQQLYFFFDENVAFTSVAVVRPLWGCFDWRSILVGFNEKWGIKVRISWISFIETWLRNNFQLTWENKTDFPFLARKIEAGKALHYLSIIRHSTEVGFTHQTQPSWVRFLTSG